MSGGTRAGAREAEGQQALMRMGWEWRQGQEVNDGGVQRGPTTMSGGNRKSISC